MDVLVKHTGQSGDAVPGRATEGGVPFTADITRFWTAKGYGRQAMATGAVASLVVRPTTVAMATLRNNSTTKLLVVERVFGHNLVAVANSAFSLWLCLHPTLAAVTNDITVRDGLNGGTGGSETSFDNGATVTDDGWYPWGLSDHTVTVTVPGGVVEAPVNGRIIVPPGGAISGQSVASTTGVTITMGFHWFEVPISGFMNNY